MHKGEKSFNRDWKKGQTSAKNAISSNSAEKGKKVVKILKNHEDKNDFNSSCLEKMTRDNTKDLTIIWTINDYYRVAPKEWPP